MLKQNIKPFFGLHMGGGGGGNEYREIRESLGGSGASRKVAAAMIRELNTAARRR